MIFEYENLKGQQWKKILHQVKEPPKIQQTSELNNLIQNISKIRQDIRFKKSMYSYLKKFKPLPEIMDTHSLKELTNKINEAELHLKNKESELNKTKQDLKKTKGDLKKIIQKTSICPTCGQEININLLIDKTKFT
jgi:hypothetical protein